MDNSNIWSEWAIEDKLKGHMRQNQCTKEEKQRKIEKTWGGRTWNGGGQKLVLNKRKWAKFVYN